MADLIRIVQYDKTYIKEAIEIWNEVVIDGVAFPQTECLDEITGDEFFTSQTYTGLAFVGEELSGLYILHPNNIGRCGHICNASYAVKSEARGKGIGKLLVEHCIKQGAIEGFAILQFNAVVGSNKTALALYKKLGFTRLGVIPKGFLNKYGVYDDIIPHYIELN